MDRPCIRKDPMNLAWKPNGEKATCYREGCDCDHPKPRRKENEMLEKGTKVNVLVYGNVLIPNGEYAAVVHGFGDHGYRVQIEGSGLWADVPVGNVWPVMIAGRNVEVRSDFGEPLGGLRNRVFIDGMFIGSTQLVEEARIAAQFLAQYSDAISWALGAKGSDL